MSKLFDKLFKLKQKEDSRDETPVVILPTRDFGGGEHAVADDRAISGTEQVVSVDDEIDIRLDLDLTNFNLPRVEQEQDDLDIDLTGTSGSDRSFLETQVLNVNPLKTFSQRVEIDTARMNEQGYITTVDVNAVLSNTFRTIKRPILNNVDGKGATVLDNANLIMTTSSFSGEGKTYSAINLALSIAMERDKQVLLIDADVSKPSHHQIFGLDNDVGLTDLLMGNVDDVSRIIHKTNIPSFSIMYAGTRNPHATELFASQSMEQFVNELASRYEDRVIIFDSAPLLLPTEAAVLAPHMGQVVLIIEAERTLIEHVRKSKEMLSNRIILSVLNKVREKEGAVYGYGYGAYGAYGAPESE